MNIQLPKSLTVRAVAAALVWIILALGIGGFAILKLYGASAERQLDARLEAQLSLLAAAMVRENVAPSSLMTEPAFARVYSGWYWQAIANEGTQYRSRSLWDTILIFPEASGEVASSDIIGPNAQALRLLTRAITVDDEKWQLAIAADRVELDAELTIFRQNLLLSGSAICAVLLVAAFLLLQAALRPLQTLRTAVAKRRDTSSVKITGTFPSEVHPLVDDLNDMLEKNERLREKGKVQAANLAHALKTPAAILRNELAKAGRNEIVDLGIAQQALDRISGEADRHLAAAASAPQNAIPGAKIDAAVILRETVSALHRLFPKLSFEIECPESFLVSIDQNDVQEIFGNLLENAGKWADSKILARLVFQDGIRIDVEDDGPGVPANQRNKILLHGIRLDETKSGSGLGLAIVSDIVERYDGRLDLGASPLGGLRISTVFPIQNTSDPQA